MDPDWGLLQPIVSMKTSDLLAPSHLWNLSLFVNLDLTDHMDGLSDLMSSVWEKNLTLMCYMPSLETLSNRLVQSRRVIIRMQQRIVATDAPIIPFQRLPEHAL